MRLELETYTPSEAETITAVGQTTVRNWRRAGHLPRQEGHARYTLQTLLPMFVMGLLVSRGTKPEAAKAFAGATASAIQQSAIWSAAIFSEDVKAKAKEELGEIVLPDPLPLEVEIGADKYLEMVTKVRLQEIMATAAEQHVGVAGIKRPTWLVLWADDTMTFFHDDESPDVEFFGNIEYSQGNVQGPVTLFCLDALAQMVVDRLPRPAFRLAEGV